MKSFAKIVLFTLATSAAVSSGLAQVSDSCLVYFDSIPLPAGYGSYLKGNPDSVLVDTCSSLGIFSSNWNGDMYATHWLHVTFKYDVFHIPPAPTNSIIEVTWEAVDTNYHALRDSLRAYAGRFGAYVFRKDNPLTSDTSWMQNDMFSIRFSRYVSMDSAKRYFIVPLVSVVEWAVGLVNVTDGVVAHTSTILTNPMQIFPNPANTKIHVNSNFTSSAFLFDECGRNVKSWKTIPEVMDVSDLPSGTYELISGNNSIRFIIYR